MLVRLKLNASNLPPYNAMNVAEEKVINISMKNYNTYWSILQGKILKY